MLRDVHPHALPPSVLPRVSMALRPNRLAGLRLAVDIAGVLQAVSAKVTASAPVESP
jgi:hypothetical protein